MVRKKIQDIITNKNQKQTLTQDLLSKKNKNGGKGKIIFSIIVLLSLIALSVKAVDFFSKAVIQISLHQETINVDTVLKAGAGSGFDLPLELMEINTTEEKTVVATGVEDISEKASGKIAIFNAYNSQPQTLIANTRFETTDGKIYRIDKRITVPGAKVEGSKITPSSVEVTVFADQPGEAYNIDRADFTIPGFKGGDRYEKFYARSIAPISGGFAGTRPVIEDEDSRALETELENIIKSNLLERAKQQNPEGYVLYDAISEMSFSENEYVGVEEIESENSKFTIKKTGTLKAFILPVKELSSVLVKKYLGEDYLGKVEIINAKDLEVSLISKNEENTSVIFKLKGAGLFSWLIDEDKLKESLVASPKDIEKVFATYTEIDKASVMFRPSWWKFFPDKTSKIKVEHMGF